jgi:hypothetical protein
MNAAPPASGGSDTGLNVLYGLAYVVVLYVGLSVGESLYKSFTAMWKDRVELFPNTYASGSTMYTAVQNPTVSNAKTIYFSDNRRNGIEFTYCMFINIKSATFSSGEHNLHHILHKGYGRSYPLMGPGIFCWGDTNTLRIYMNSFSTWNTFTEVPNIPVDKWFHLTVSCKGNIFYVYVNGNLKQKMKFPNNTPPYQNYGNVYLFNNRKLQLTKAKTASLDSENLNINVNGSVSGMVSRVYYFSYALTYTEIQSMINNGPSTVINSTDMSISPYLADTWWTNPRAGISPPQASLVVTQ